MSSHMIKGALDLQKSSTNDDYQYFENGYLFRILFTSIILSIAQAQFAQKHSPANTNKFKITIRNMMLTSLCGEILAFICSQNENNSNPLKPSVMIHKLFVDLVFITFNCSVCYAMAIYLKADKSTLLKIWYISIAFTLIYLISHLFFRVSIGFSLNYLMNGIISIYSLILLYKIRNKHSDLFVIRLIYLEWYIVIISFIVYLITLFIKHYLGLELLVYIVNQCRMTVSMAFVVKMYIFIVEWGTKSAATASNADQDESDAMFVVARK